MKIYFTCSTADFNTHRESYFKVRNILISEGHLLTRDWLPHTEDLIKTKSTELRNVKQIYKECIQAVKEADLVIVEDTVSNFSTGHQITVALQNKKPTLVLWQGNKHRVFSQMFIHGLESDILEVIEYNQENLEQIVKVFIEKYSNIDEKNRFHLVLNNMERQYLDWAQYSKNKSRTKIIKEALKSVIENDPDYTNYLSKHEYK